MIGIRQKLMLGFGGLLAVVLVIGVLTMGQIDRLGLAIDVILRENYRSVVACEDMKEALERLDSGILFSFAGNETESGRIIGENSARFLSALKVELGNITLPGEGAKAERIRTLFTEFTGAIPPAVDPARDLTDRRTAYFTTLLPRFGRIKGLVQEILVMNQTNMSEANDDARREAVSARRRVLIAIVACAVLSILFSFLSHRWILTPINRLIESTNEIRRGNLDLVLNGESRDELGRLSDSFNEMTAVLRRVRQHDRMDLLRTRRATEEVFKALPMAIAVLDPEGRVEVSTETAASHFGLKPGILAGDLGYEWLSRLFHQALEENRMVESNTRDGVIQQFVDNREYFFQPLVMPIPVGSREAEPTGVAVILKDVTQVHEQQELKRSVVSTVSHQLKTPLTSLRMCIHLLLEERVGGLNEKQTDLLVAARDESERLSTILEDLLNIARVEARGRNLAPEPASPHVLAREGVEPFLAEARDKGVAIVNAVPDNLPRVMADAAGIRTVFANLLSNGLRFTKPGGEISIRASEQAHAVRFSIRDTGMGIPSEYLNRLFEQFFRVPGQDDKSGVGLGLAIVKEIVWAHGGEVFAESVSGEGSVFHFTLPLEEDHRPTGNGDEAEKPS